MKNIILLSFIISLAFSCKTEQKKDVESHTEELQANGLIFSSLPSLPQDQFQKLFEEVTYVDYIFYDLPFSISQDDKPSINANLQLISAEKLGPININCKPIGREFFHIGGVIAFEAEIYFQNGCFGYVFLDKETPIYANKISESGMKFYTNLTSQAEQIKNKALNGG
jgi:hypothetical protein